MTDLTDNELAKIRAREQAATPGPWRTNTIDHVGEDWLIGIIDCGDAETESGVCRKHIVTTDNLRASQGNGSTAKDDADFIAHAREDIPALLSIIDEQQAEIERLREDLGAHDADTDRYLAWCRSRPGETGP